MHLFSRDSEVHMKCLETEVHLFWKDKYHEVPPPYSRVPQKYNLYSIYPQLLCTWHYLISTLVLCTILSQHVSSTVFVPVVRGVLFEVCVMIWDWSREKKEHTGLGIILGESDESVELPGLDTLPIWGVIGEDGAIDSSAFGEITRARPKSQIFKVQSVLRSTFAGFKSLCTCSYSSDYIESWMRNCVRAGVRGVRVLLTTRSECWKTRSKYTPRTIFAECM